MSRDLENHYLREVLLCKRCSGTGLSDGGFGWEPCPVCGGIRDELQGSCKLQINRIILGDCLDVMPIIPDQSVNMVLCDLPYGTTKNSWDSVIPLDCLWNQYERVIKDDGVIVLTASQPFTSLLVSSNPKLFKYAWVWDKSQITGFLNAKKQPLRRHEDILVFYKSQPTYNPIKTKGSAYSRGIGKTTPSYNTHIREHGKVETTERYPTSIISIPQVREKGGHPTQKPVKLFEYLIKTYTHKGDTVLDNCIGSGTTAIACINTNRNYIGVEKDHYYYEQAIKRIDGHLCQQNIEDYNDPQTH